MVPPIQPNEIFTDHYDPPTEVEYSKLKVIAVFALTVPVFLIWTALSIVAFPFLKICNAIGCKWNLGNSLMDECFDLWIAALRYFCEPAKVTPGDGKPILLVHGYLHNASGWFNAIETMKESGCGPIYTINLGDATLSGKFWPIRCYAKQVYQKVQEILEETGSDRVALVGHSMGGIVSCLYATLDPNSVSDVVTIGAPLRGTWVADWFGIGADGEEMQTDDPDLGLIRAKMEDTPGVNFYSVASQTDEIVPLASALHGEDPLKQMILEDHGHLSLMTSKKVAEQVASWINS